MTTIYTKPQLDQIAVKIGSEIKKNKTAIAAIKPASTTVAGIVQLNNTVTSTLTTQAATANAVKLANDKATAAIPNTQKGVVNGVATLGADGKVLPAQLPLSVATAWGNITGNIAAQTDLADMYFTIADFNVWAEQVGQALTHSRLNGDFYDITTTEPPNTHIDADGKMKRSTATMPVFGTAATKNVGTAAGNVMQVAAFGLGGDASAYLLLDDSNRFTLPTGFYVANNVVGAPSEYGSIARVAANAGTWITDIFYPANEYAAPSIRTSINGREFPSWDNLVVSNRVSKNIITSGIQAGIGAPKIAHKKLTGTMRASSGDVLVPHGLTSSNILSVNVILLNKVGDYMQPNYTQGDTKNLYQVAVTNTDIKVSISGAPADITGQPFKILITYEV